MLLPLLVPVLLPVLLEPLLLPMSEDVPVELSLDFLCFLWCFLPVVVEDWLLAPWSLAVLLEVCPEEEVADDWLWSEEGVDAELPAWPLWLLVAEGDDD